MSSSKVKLSCVKKKKRQSIQWNESYILMQSIKYNLLVSPAGEDACKQTSASVRGERERRRKKETKNWRREKKESR